jgi:deoxycytidylate deaminase
MSYTLIDSFGGDQVLVLACNTPGCKSSTQVTLQRFLTTSDWCNHLVEQVRTAGWELLYGFADDNHKVYCSDCVERAPKQIIESLAGTAITEPAKPERPDFETYARNLAKEASTRSTCGRAKIGAIAMTADHRIVATAYNGVGPGEKHCADYDEPVTFGNHDMLCEHAEVNIGKQLRVLFDSFVDALKMNAGWKTDDYFFKWVRSQQLTVYTYGPRDCCTYCAKTLYRIGIDDVVVTQSAEAGAAA